MPAATERHEFAPPRTAGAGSSLGLALLAHGLLLAALAWGVSWKHQTPNNTVQAELWSALPQIAAPAAPPPPAPAEPVPAPKAPLEQKITTAPALPVESAKPPEIIVKKTQSKAVPKEEPEEEEDEKPAPPLKKTKPEVKLEPKPEPKINKAQEAKKRAEQQEKEEKEQALEREKLRQEQMRRMSAQAGSGSGADAQTSAPVSQMSAGWGDRIKARVNPRISNRPVDTSGLRPLELSISIAPDGTIVSRPRIIKSSGNHQWDDAVVRGFEAAGSIPRDSQGKLPQSPFLLTWIASE